MMREPEIGGREPIVVDVVAGETCLGVPLRALQEPAVLRGVARGLRKSRVKLDSI